MQWEEFTQALCVRFGPSDYEDFDEALTKVRQIGTVREYQMLFERLAARVQDWPQRAMVGSYIGGLKEEIRSEVKLFGPTTLLHATSLARFQEDKLQRLKRVSFPSKSAPLPTTQPALLPTPPSRWIKAGTSPSSSSRTQSSPSFKKLSWTEMQAQRDKGLCYNCDEKFGSGHRCKTQQVFILETVADAEESAEVEDASNEEEESATTPEISLHALSKREALAHSH